SHVSKPAANGIQEESTCAKPAVLGSCASAAATTASPVQRRAAPAARGLAGRVESSITTQATCGAAAATLIAFRSAQAAGALASDTPSARMNCGPQAEGSQSST